MLINTAVDNDTGAVNLNANGQHLSERWLRLFVANLHDRHETHLLLIRCAFAGAATPIVQQALTDAVLTRNGRDIGAGHKTRRCDLRLVLRAPSTAAILADDDFDTT
ncbi:hypothetical protein LPU83_pLPU83d_1093 (plasmid) [Rhizobium favelukesii]|uniref:Uncharacterized protein n=1 Tax=Rhizobium favelukesii TaxID=348824 RepID=W6RUY7_9HYPH|nr:hypothetical protein LPU83_pLPU83d_1093 [Rhizobium favelukesii]